MRTNGLGPTLLTLGMMVSLTCRADSWMNASHPPRGDDWYFKASEEYSGWKFIVIHHSATGTGDLDRFDRDHFNRGLGGIAYHFVIGNGKGMRDGQIRETFRWREQIAGNHVATPMWKHNLFGIGICLVGNFQKQRPTRRQLRSLRRLVSSLMGRYQIPLRNVIAHNIVARGSNKHHTLCPGRHFHLKSFKRKLKRFLRRRKSNALAMRGL